MNFRERIFQVVNEALEVYERNKTARDNEWTKMTAEKIMGTILSKIDKMKNEFDENGDITTPYMFQDDIRDGILWWFFLLMKADEKQMKDVINKAQQKSKA